MSKPLTAFLKVAEKNHKKFMMDWSSGWYLYSFFGNTGLDFGVNDDNVTNHCDWNSTEGRSKVWILRRRCLISVPAVDLKMR